MQNVLQLTHAAPQTCIPDHTAHVIAQEAVLGRPRAAPPLSNSLLRGCDFHVCNGHNNVPHQPLCGLKPE